MNTVVSRVALGVLALSVAAAAQAELSPENMIKFRQSGYTFMSWNMGKIKAQVVDAAVPYDQGQVAAAANVIAAIANSGMGALYSPATLDGKGWKQTRLEKKFFDEQDKVREIAMNFVKQANKLQEVAAAGDQKAIATQFGEVGKACKACHDNYRAEE
ncbi:MAG: c-type cytochrome [Thiotrichales bacterium]